MQEIIVCIRIVQDSACFPTSQLHIYLIEIEAFKLKPCIPAALLNHKTTSYNFKHHKTEACKQSSLLIWHAEAHTYSCSNINHLLTTEKTTHHSHQPVIS